MATFVMQPANPASSRFLELIDQHLGYKRHMSAVSTAKAAVNTTGVKQPHVMPWNNRHKQRDRDMKQIIEDQNLAFVMKLKDGEQPNDDFWNGQIMRRGGTTAGIYNRYFGKKTTFRSIPDSELTLRERLERKLRLQRSARERRELESGLRIVDTFSNRGTLRRQVKTPRRTKRVRKRVVRDRVLHECETQTADEYREDASAARSPEPGTTETTDLISHPMEPMSQTSISQSGRSSQRTPRWAKRHPTEGDGPFLTVPPESVAREGDDDEVEQVQDDEGVGAHIDSYSSAVLSDRHSDDEKDKITDDLAGEFGDTGEAHMTTESPQDGTTLDPDAGGELPSDLDGEEIELSPPPGSRPASSRTPSMSQGPSRGESRGPSRGPPSSMAGNRGQYVRQPSAYEGIMQHGPSSRGMAGSRRDDAISRGPEGHLANLRGGTIPTVYDDVAGEGIAPNPKVIKVGTPVKKAKKQQPSAQYYYYYEEEEEEEEVADVVKASPRSRPAHRKWESAYEEDSEDQRGVKGHVKPKSTDKGGKSSGKASKAGSRRSERGAKSKAASVKASEDESDTKSKKSGKASKMSEKGGKTSTASKRKKDESSSEDESSTEEQSTSESVKKSSKKPSSSRATSAKGTSAKRASSSRKSSKTTDDSSSEYESSSDDETSTKSSTKPKSSTKGGKSSSRSSRKKSGKDSSDDSSDDSEEDSSDEESTTTSSKPVKKSEAAKKSESEKKKSRASSRRSKSGDPHPPQAPKPKTDSAAGGASVRLAGKESAAKKKEESSSEDESSSEEESSDESETSSKKSSSRRSSKLKSEKSKGGGKSSASAKKKDESSDDDDDDDSDSDDDSDDDDSSSEEESSDSEPADSESDD
jgi:hypothetical protein